MEPLNTSLNSCDFGVEKHRFPLLSFPPSIVYYMPMYEIERLSHLPGSGEIVQSVRRDIDELQSMRLKNMAKFHSFFNSSNFLHILRDFSVLFEREILKRWTAMKILVSKLRERLHPQFSETIRESSLIEIHKTRILSLINVHRIETWIDAMDQYSCPTCLINRHRKEFLSLHIENITEFENFIDKTYRCTC